MPLAALLFDLDGTLTDTNELHTRAWRQALEQYDFRVGSDRLAKEIGKGGTMLVPDVLGEEAERAYGDALRDAHDARYAELLRHEGAHPFDRAADLLRAARDRGLRTAIATASKKEALEQVVERTGLDVFALADVVVTDTDVDRSKPHPDVVAAAVRKLGLAPTQCAMVGDTPYDVAAARQAGVAVLGVLTGVHAAAALRRAGARAVYRDAADLLDHLDEALALCAPGDDDLPQATVDALMEAALEQARAALAVGEVPIGAVVARADGTILARGYNRTDGTGSELLHAEIEAFRDIMDWDALEGERLVLASTLEPCAMCFGAAVNAAVETILYGLAAPSDGATETGCLPPIRPDRLPPRLVGGLHADASRALLQAWQERHGPVDYLEVLLRQT